MAGPNADRRCAAPRDERGLAASVAHEINNPLAVILNLLSLLEAEPALTEQGHQYLTLAQQEVHRISEIAHETLDLYGHKTPPEHANVAELLEAVVTLYKSRLESRGITVKTRYCRDGSLPVYARQLRQVFSNLLLNAADAMPRGGKMYARVSAAHEWNGRKRRGLRVTLADNGCGIAARDLPRILEPFFTTKGSAGSGIGLALVNDTVRKHGGALRVRSTTKPGRSGSVFAIFLPAA